ncbi:MAG: extracellular solute-binding protein [Planctomycetota bacterium]
MSTRSRTFQGFVLLAIVSLLQAGCSQPSGSTSTPEANGSAGQTADDSTQQPAAARMMVLCGSSMVAPVKELGESFAEGKDLTIEYDLGGSETLLPKVQTGIEADIFVCHDPFQEKVSEAGQLAGSVTVGYLAPIVVVAKGNPANIKTWEDLTRDGVRLGIGDPRYSTCGEMFVAEIKRRGNEEAVMKNVVLQARGHADLATALATKNIDAAVVWNFIDHEFADKLEKAPIHGEYDDVKVTILGLKNSAHPELRDEYLKWCERPETQQLFAKHGYTRSGEGSAQ